MSPQIEFNGARVFLIDLALPPDAAPPARLTHRLTLRGGATPAPQPQRPVTLEYLAAPLTLSTNVPKIGPPLKGRHWVALNGCCEPAGVHRSTNLSVNGGLHFAQRFAIDWMQLDESGRLVNFIGRLDGPLHFRFYMQPLMAIALATIDGRQDARMGRPFYAREVCTDPLQRRQLLLDGWKRISRVFFIALAIDFAYQLIVRHGFQPLEALWVALLLAIVPYVASRGPVNRLLRLRYATEA